MADDQPQNPDTPTPQARSNRVKKRLAEPPVNPRQSELAKGLIAEAKAARAERKARLDGQDPDHAPDEVMSASSAWARGLRDTPDPYDTWADERFGDRPGGRSGRG